jgi:hypothetical protein
MFPQPPVGIQQPETHRFRQTPADVSLTSSQSRRVTRDFPPAAGYKIQPGSVMSTRSTMTSPVTGV